MQPGIYVDPADYYELAAEFIAKHLGKHAISSNAAMDCKGLVMYLRSSIQYLPNDTWESIESNPHEFCQRVSEYLYGIAMNDKDA
jgi:hypothetical protein